MGEGTRGLPFAQAGGGLTRGWGLWGQGPPGSSLYGAATASWLLGRAASSPQAALLGHPHHPSLAQQGAPSLPQRGPLQTGDSKDGLGPGPGDLSDRWGSYRSRSRSGIRVQVSQWAARLTRRPSDVRGSQFSTLPPLPPTLPPLPPFALLLLLPVPRL